jgi:hypothetical protein
MLTWIVESTTLLTILLATVALAFVAGWWRTRKSNFLFGAAVALAVIAALFAVGYFVETDGQKLEHSVQEMAEGVKTHKLDRTFAQISESFNYGGIDKKTLCDKVNGTVQVRNVTAVDVWDFQTEEVSREKRTARVHFRVKPRGNWDAEGMTYRCVADFVLDPDDQWRLKTFNIYDPVSTTPRSIPW